MKTLSKLTLAGVLLSATAAQAVVTPPTWTGWEVDSFGTDGSTADVSIGVLNETLSVSLFDPSVATVDAGETLRLRGVEWYARSSMSSVGSVTNNSGVNARGTMNVIMTANWQAAAGAPISETDIFAATGTSVISAESAPAGTYDILPGGTWNSGDLTTGVLSSGTQSIAMNVTGGQWFQPGTIDALFTAAAFTGVGGEAESGTGSFDISFATAAWGDFGIRYLYEVIDTPVPTPAPLALLALGALGLARVRRTK